MSKLILTLFLSVFIFSCSTNQIENKVTVSSNENNSRESLDAKTNNNETKLNDSIKLFVENFGNWFEKENFEYTELVNHIELKEDEVEWNGTIPDYEKYRNSILEKAEKSIINSSFFTSSFIEKSKNLLSDTSNVSQLINLPSILLNSSRANLIQQIIFPVNKTPLNEIIKHKNGNVYEVICGQVEAGFGDNPDVVLEIVKIKNEFKINNISFETE